LSVTEIASAMGELTYLLDEIKSNLDSMEDKPFTENEDMTSDDNMLIDKLGEGNLPVTLEEIAKIKGKFKKKAINNVVQLKKSIVNLN